MQIIPHKQKNQQANILLIYADFAKNTLGTNSYPENHLGLNRLATYLDEKGYKVKILNTTGLPAGTNGPQHMAEFLHANSDEFDALGFHLNSWNISHVISCLKLLQPKFAQRLILFGGPLPTAEPQKVLELFNALGYTNLGLVQGYGEFKLEEIMARPGKIKEIEGVWSITNGTLNKGKLQRPTEQQLAQIPLLNPEYNSFYQQYFKPAIEAKQSNRAPEKQQIHTQINSPDHNSGRGTPATPPAIEQPPHLTAQTPASTAHPPTKQLDILFGSQGLDVNQGCPFSCSYCSVHIFGHQVTEYSPQRCADELERTAKETGMFMFTYTNSNLMFVRRDWIIEFCNELINRNLHEYITWSGYHHPNTINLLNIEDLKLMKKAGCEQIVIGIQSVEPRILKLFNRHPNTYAIFKQIVEKAKLAGQEIVIDYIRGIPGEDLNIVEEFYDYCIQNKIELREFLLKIYPNTEIINKGIDFSDYELVPITGILAPELDSYAVLPKKENPKNIQLSQKIRKSNAEIARTRKIRLGQYYVDTEATARALKETVIPNNAKIPKKVRNAMITMLDLMLNPPPQTNPLMNLAPEQMLKTLLNADSSSPPIIQNLREKMLQKMGPEEFEKLKQKYNNL